MDELPVLYAPLFGGKLDTSEQEVELARLFVRKADCLLEHGADFVEYIPARRCKTCRYWVDCGHHFDCVAWNGCSECPPDGSGFCHNYEGMV